MVSIDHLLIRADFREDHNKDHFIHRKDYLCSRASGRKPLSHDLTFVDIVTTQEYDKRFDESVTDFDEKPDNMCAYCWKKADPPED